MKLVLILTTYSLLLSANCLNDIQVGVSEHESLAKQHCNINCKMYFTSSEDILFEEATFTRPVILGASVSAGYTTNLKKGPSSHFLESIEIPTYKNISIPGSTSQRMIKAANKSKNYNESSVKVAIDLFFWDSVKIQNCSEENIEKLYSGKVYESLFKGPSILAQVPNINSSQKPECLSSINSVLEKMCNSKSCKLLKSFGKEFKELKPSQMNDELHPNDIGAQILGEKMCSLMML